MNKDVEKWPDYTGWESPRQSINRWCEWMEFEEKEGDRI